MNILPKKSWHVRNKDNIAKVHRDEENARLEEEKLAKRAALAEQEARTKLLRDRVHSHRSVSGLQSCSVESATTSITPYNESQTRNINLFEDVESGSVVAKATNTEYEAEKKVEQEKREKAIGVLRYLGESAVEGQTPWYLKKEYKDDQKMSVTESTKDADRKNRLDPLFKMNSFLVKTKESKMKKKEKIKKNKKRHKEVPTKGKKTIEELRVERLRREKEERFREDKLIRERKRGQGCGAEEEDPYRESYYSQYNPHLAKKSKWNCK